MGYLNVNKSKFPIIIIEFLKAEPTEEEFNSYLKTMYDIYSTNKNIVIIYDTRNTKYLKAGFRIELGKWLKQNRVLINESVSGVIYLVSSPITKVVLQGIFLIQKPIWKNKIVTGLDNALEKANDFLN